MGSKRYPALGEAPGDYVRGWHRYCPPRRPAGSESHPPRITMLTIALLLIQGLGFDRASWGSAIGPSQRRFRLVLVDNRAAGAAPRGPV